MKSDKSAHVVTRVKERDNMSRQMVIDKITKEADKIAIEYNKTKDSGLRDQWFKLVSSLRNFQPSHNETSDTVLCSPPGLRKKPHHQIK